MRLLPITLALTLTTAAHGADVWVDPVHGDDLNPGTELEPLRTITAAVSRPDAMVRLAPGIYSIASGEAFPILLEGTDSISAMGDASDTRILLPDNGAPSWAGSIIIEAESSIVGVTLEQAGADHTAVRLVDAPHPINTRLRLTDSRVLGGRVGVAGDDGYLTIERCEFSGQDHSAVKIFRTWTQIRDVTIQNVGNGVHAETMASPVSLERVSILDARETAVHLFNWNYAVPFRVSMRDCLLAGHDVGLLTAQGLLYTEVTMSGCTIVSDTGRGVVNSGHTQAGMISITDSIVAGHPGGDLAGVGRFEYSLAEDGVFPAHHTGSVSGDPRFLDPASGDYRLGWGSPCIDTASPGFSRDLLGHSRVVDGDLELTAAPDMGALEHLTLSGPRSIALGQPIPLEVTGPMGGFSTVVISPTGFAAEGTTTQYGRFFLDPTAAFRLVPVPTYGLAPTQVLTPAFTAPTLVGAQIGIQALTRSLAAPAGGAFSQPILVRIDP